MEKTVYNGQFIKVTESIISGHKWEKVFLPPSLAVFPIEGDYIYLIEESRPHETKPSRVKFVTGHIENNEDILECANRELQEEIGFKASKLELIHHHQASGTLNSNFFMVSARELTPSKIPNPDGEETIIAIKKLHLDDVYNMIFKHEITWGLSCLGFLKLYHQKKGTS
tara:strand:- start:172619 stop:173125 length:507 start_codon:yes stop_codon:yes gene_type:complete